MGSADAAERREVVVFDAGGEDGGCEAGDGFGVWEGELWGCRGVIHGWYWRGLGTNFPVDGVKSLGSKMDEVGVGGKAECFVLGEGEVFEIGCLV